MNRRQFFRRTIVTPAKVVTKVAKACVAVSRKKEELKEKALSKLKRPKKK